MLVSVLLLMASGVRADPEQPAELPVVKVWKTPSCGCCGKWVRHMQDAGFRVEVTDVANVDPIKAANGIPPGLASCHACRRVRRGWMCRVHRISTS